MTGDRRPQLEIKGPIQSWLEFHSKANERYFYVTGLTLYPLVWLPYAHESVERLSVRDTWSLLTNECLVP